jgi:hypothetical protein
MYLKSLSEKVVSKQYYNEPLYSSDETLTEKILNPINGISLLRNKHREIHSFNHGNTGKSCTLLRL